VEIHINVYVNVYLLPVSSNSKLLSKGDRARIQQFFYKNKGV
jgi:hypothetical protein